MVPVYLLKSCLIPRLLITIRIEKSRISLLLSLIPFTFKLTLTSVPFEIHVICQTNSFICRLVISKFFNNRNVHSEYFNDPIHHVYRLAAVKLIIFLSAVQLFCIFKQTEYVKQATNFIFNDAIWNFSALLFYFHLFHL